jgi:Tfp pilus assembly protein PilZ
MIARGDRRASIRFDKVFRVTVTTDGYGEMQAIARNISDGGMMIETPMPFPLGTEVVIAFAMPDRRSAITARAEVKNHYAFNYCVSGEPCAARGIGVRFLDFVEDRARAAQRTLH